MGRRQFWCITFPRGKCILLQGTDWPWQGSKLRDLTAIHHRPWSKLLGTWRTRIVTREYISCQGPRPLFLSCHLVSRTNTESKWDYCGPALEFSNLIHARLLRASASNGLSLPAPVWNRRHLWQCALRYFGLRFASSSSSSGKFPFNAVFLHSQMLLYSTILHTVVSHFGIHVFYTLEVVMPLLLPFFSI